MTLFGKQDVSKRKKKALVTAFIGGTSHYPQEELRTVKVPSRLTNSQVGPWSR